MRAYVDTNILVDLVLSRQEFLPDAQRVFAIGYAGEAQLELTRCLTLCEASDKPRRAAPKATASGRPPSFSLPPSPATLKFPQKPQECREIVVYLHRRNS